MIGLPDASYMCPKKSGRSLAEVLRAEVNRLWHSVLPTSSKRDPLEIQPESCGTVHEPELACRHPGHASVRVHLGGRVTNYLQKNHCSRAQIGIMRSAAFFEDDARCNNGIMPVKEISAHARNGTFARAAVSRHTGDGDFASPCRRKTGGSRRSGSRPMLPEYDDPADGSRPGRRAPDAEAESPVSRPSNWFVDCQLPWRSPMTCSISGHPNLFVI